MHPNPSFRKESEERNIEFAKERAFGTLAINSTDGPLLSHVPFLMDDDNKSIELHLVRSNPILRALTEPQAGVYQFWEVIVTSHLIGILSMIRSQPGIT